MSDEAPIDYAADTERRARRRVRLAWHRRVGLVFGLVFLLVAATGVALNHSVGLGLQRRPIEAGWLYRWYGMQPAGEPVGFDLGEGKLAVGLAGSLYLDGRALAGLDDLRGALRLGETQVAAGSRELLLLTPSGEIIERLDSASLPPGELRSLARVADGDEPARLALLMSSGRYVFDRDLVGWSALPASSTAQTVAPVPVPPELRDRIVRAYRGDGLTVYRIVLDMHSGRFFGPIGVAVVDLAALAMVFLTLTGVWYVWRRRRTG